MRRKFKQLIYLLFFALCWTTFFVTIYFLFLKPKPSCFDNKQNQGEQGVDCGGPCATVCIPQTLKSISIVNRVVFLQTTTGHYIVFAEVKNENPGFAARSFHYTFTAFDNVGRVTQTASGDSFMYSGDVRYLFEPDVVSDFPVAKATLDISNIDWVKSDLFLRPKLNVPHFETTKSGPNLDVEGRVTNADTIPFAHVTVVAIFRGDLGQFAGASRTELDNLAPDETRQFTVLYPAVVKVDPLGTQVFVYAFRP